MKGPFTVAEEKMMNERIVTVDLMRRSDAYTIEHFVPSKELMYRAADAIRAINESQAYVISVDINSGLNGDTGEAVLAVKSDLTVSIGYYKQGLFRGDADKYIDKLTNVDIGIVLLDERIILGPDMVL